MAARQAERVEAAGLESAEKNADALADARLLEAAELAEDATRTEQEATAEKQRLEREAAAARQRAAQLRADTEK